MKMTRSQTLALARVRLMIVRAAFLDLETKGALGQPLPVSEDAIAGSSYEFAEWRVDAGWAGTIFLYARVRKKDPATLGHQFPAVYHLHIGRLGAIRELGGPSAQGRRIGLAGYLRGR
jgi:hypothetical protein